MSVDSAAPCDGPASRAEVARARAVELRRRREELGHGIAPTLDSAERAHQNAIAAYTRAETAHHAAADRHLEASRIHRMAAAAHEQAALIAGDENAESHMDAAANHRAEAERHEAAAAEDFQFELDDADRRASSSGEHFHQ